MPLSATHKAVLALGLTAARHLDEECCDDEDDAILAKRRAARGILYKGVQGAPAHVTSLDGVAPYLSKNAGELKRDVGLDNADVRAAHDLLTTLALGVRNNDGDGIAHPALGPDGCACGILELAGLVEQRIRSALGNAEINLPPDDPAVHYATYLVEEHDLLTTFRVGGKADIVPSPRIVYLMLKLGEVFTARDMLHLAYTLHHELVCHAFQSALSDGPRINAHHKCHWTEGWMDTLAHDLTKAWIAEDMRPANWIALAGESAVGEVRNFHDERYLRPPRMEKNDVKRRRWARDAYRAFVKTLERAALARSKEEADRLGEKFSLLLNTHAEADCKRLRKLATNLRIALVSRKRLEPAISVVQAGLAFVHDRNLNLLEQRVELAVVS
jgi:hypothetical protein